ncbi:hypothetical protein [Streptomyces sp. NPDC020983]|uniref:hypothetical protein n=1 Tax=Streptomyces sp. NPDC020983 TaxID=3365106 RepID=UPI0037991A2B
MVLNPNWPVLETAWGPMWDAGGGLVPVDRWCEVVPIGSLATGRGRQYALDQVQAGTGSMTLPNTDGRYDPDNTTGPFAGRIRPFQPVRWRAQWPPTPNLLRGVQATGGDSGGYPLGTLSQGTDGPRILTGTDPAGGALVASGTAWQGSTVIAMAVPASAAAGQWICYTEQPAVRPGTTYTVQLRVRNVTPSTSVQVAAGIRTLTATGTAATTAAGSTVTLAGSATAAWTQVTVTATAAATSAALAVGVQLVTAPGATATVQIDGWQLEKGPAATAWVQPGTWYWITSQFTERWPAAWLDGGTRGVVQPSSVDAFALLSQRTLRDVLTEEIYSHGLRFLYALGDPQGSGQVTDASGTYGPASINSSKYGKGSVTFGTTITATDPVSGIFAGSGTVCTVSNSSPGTNLYASASFIDLTTAGIRGPANSAGDWARMIAFRYTGPRPTAGNFASLWCSLDRNPVLYGGSALEFMIDSNGHFALIASGPTGDRGGVTINAVTVDDGNWHLAIASYRGATRALTVNVDGTGTGSILAATRVPTGLVSDSIGAEADPARGNATAWNFKGDLAYAAEWDSYLPDQAIFDLQDAWRDACTGDSTDTRYKRILTYAGYLGYYDVAAGATTSMGPAQLDGIDAFSALQAVVDTEGGAHWITGAGTLTFRPRTARYNQLTPAFTFGERTDLGEWPYEDCQPDFDSTHLGGIVEVTQATTGQIFTAIDDASVQAYFPRSLARTVNASDPLECQDAANYLKSRFAQPSTRVASLKLHPSAVPALWPICLQLEQGTRIRVMRRPLGAPPISIDCFVEKLDWTMDDRGEAVLIVQASRADTLVYGRFAAWHTTLKVAAAVGATTITVNASQDTVNPLAAQLAQGQSLVLGQGTANAETVTVQSVGTTTAGWTSAVITLTAATTKAHAAGDVVCEPLPAGVTDPTAYDAASAFDAVAFTY